MAALLLDLFALAGVACLVAAAWCCGTVAGLAATGCAVLIISALISFVRPQKKD